MSLVKNRLGYMVGENERECTKCRSIFPKTNNTMSICPQCNTNRVKSNDPKRRMLNRAQQRARISGLEFKITVDDIDIPETCPALAIPLRRYQGAPGGRPNSPSLDRIDNSKGYVPGNVRVISLMANVMKSSANEEQLVRFSKWILDQYEPQLKRGSSDPR